MSNTPKTNTNDWSAEKAHEGHVKLAALVNTLETQRDEALKLLAEAHTVLAMIIRKAPSSGPLWYGSEEIKEVFALQAKLNWHTPPTVATNDTSPEIFEAHGREWYRHTPGDKMPRDGEMIVRVLCSQGSTEGTRPGIASTERHEYERAH